MKREIIKLLKGSKYKLESFKSFRSDMGWQQYEILVNGALFEYSYCVSGANKLLTEFKEWIDSW